MEYIVEKQCLLTFLTHNDSYDVKIEVGEIIRYIDGEVYYNGLPSISTIQFLLYHSLVKPLY